MTKEDFINSISLEGEEWKDVVGYEGYYIVSNYGRIATVRDSYKYTRNGKSFIKNCPQHICSTSIAPTTSYERITFRANYKHDTQLVHRVVASAFIPNPNNYPNVDHIDDNPSNNIASNLQWCNQKINNSKEHHKLMISMANLGRIDSKRKAIVALKDNELIKEYPSISEIELDGHKRSAVQRILKGQLKTHHGLQWKYLSDYIPSPN